MFSVDLAGEIDAVNQVDYTLCRVSERSNDSASDGLEPTPVLFLRRSHAKPFEIHPVHGVIVSTVDCIEISRYLKVAPGYWLLSLAALGVVQQQAMRKFDLLQPEDFYHAEPENCLFAHAQDIADLVLRFESPSICPGCRNFYRKLGLIRSIYELDSILRHIPDARSS